MERACKSTHLKARQRMVSNMVQSPCVTFRDSVSLEAYKIDSGFHTDYQGLHNTKQSNPLCVCRWSPENMPRGGEDIDALLFLFDHRKERKQYG